MPDSGERWASLRGRMACYWRLPDADLDASLLLALPDDTPPRLAPAAHRRAAEIAAWSGVCLEENPTDYLLLRRKLFRAVYCDWPQLSNLLVLLAAHHARLIFRSDAETLAARQTRGAHIYVARMLGLWRLHRVWMEETMRQSSLSAYSEAAEKLGIPWSTAIDADLLENQIVARQQAWAGDDGGDLPQAGRFDIDSRMRVFTRLRRQLDEALTREFGPAGRPRLELMPMLPGVTLFYAHVRRFSLDDWLQQLPQLHLRLFCETESDCYRALGVFHRVAPPIRPSDDLRFRDFADHIARPQTNGYRALQTICQWPARNAGRLLRCHILTTRMQETNEWGVMSREENAAQTKMGLNRSLERLSHSLGRDPAANGPAANGIAAYVQRYDLNSDPDRIYCFTPKGEIFLLDKGSLPLDFAYRVHTQIGHQATRIEVNEHAANLETPLRNGDLVHIIYDPSAAGPDFSWQKNVTRERARTNIRAELRRRASQIHPGRGKFETELIHLIDVYRRDSDRRRGERGGVFYEPPIPTSADIEHFLDRVTARRRLDGRPALYALLDKHPRLAGELAHRLLSERIISDLRAPGDSLLKRQRAADIALCPTCRPTPHDAIRAYSRPVNDGDAIVIHRPGCPAISSAAEPIDLSWDESHTERWPLYLFKIGHRDEDGLLDWLLALVYDMPHTYLYRVKASVSEKERANIQLVIAVKLPQLCADLALLLARSGVEVTYSPYRGGPRRSPVPPEDRSRELDNPYTLDQVSDWRFFNRGPILEELLHWAGDTHFASPVMLLHGQQRIGKSSVAARLANKLVEQNAARSRPAFRIIPLNIDLSSSSPGDPGATADLLAQRICARLNLRRPERSPAADPFVWLDRQLMEAEEALEDTRLLIILDEFDSQLDLAVGHDPRFTLPDRLWGLIRNHAEKIRWLLIAQDAHLADPRLEGPFSRLLAAPRVHVDPLDNSYARQLIVNPMRDRGYRFADSLPGHPDIPSRALDLAAGNPYIIHLIGIELLERMGRGSRRVITDTDLNWTTHILLGRPAMLDHFTKPLLTTPTRHLVALYLAAEAPVGGRLPLAALSDELIRRRRLMDEGTLIRELTYLEKIGVLDVTANEFGDPVVTLPIQLIHRLLRRWIGDSANPHWAAALLDTPPNPDLYSGG